MAYAHHVFLSYQHTTTIAYWVRRYFHPCLEEWIEQAIAGSGRKVNVFLDVEDLRAGDKWRTRIAGALKGSCLIVPVLSPTYFTSPHCWAELMTFQERESTLARSASQAELILPVVACQGDNFPRAVKDAQYVDFSAFVTKSTAFESTPDFLLFEKRIRQFADEVASKLRRAPPFDPAWPVVDFEDQRVKEAAARHEPLIAMPSLAA